MLQWKVIITTPSRLSINKKHLLNFNLRFKDCASESGIERVKSEVRSLAISLPVQRLCPKSASDLQKSNMCAVHSKIKKKKQKTSLQLSLDTKSSDMNSYAPEQKTDLATMFGTIYSLRINLLGRPDNGVLE